jgi:hypothetical protein
VDREREGGGRRGGLEQGEGKEVRRGKAGREAMKRGGREEEGMDNGRKGGWKGWEGERKGGRAGWKQRGKGTGERGKKEQRRRK